MPADTPASDPGNDWRMAARLANRVWELLYRDDRSAADDEELLRSALTSRHHWERVGEPTHLARGEWQCSRVYATLGQAEPALHHASRCLELAQRYGLSAFDLGCAHEAMARALKLAGRGEEAATHAEFAATTANQVDQPEERQILLADLATL